MMEKWEKKNDFVLCVCTKKNSNLHRNLNFIFFETIFSRSNVFFFVYIRKLNSFTFYIIIDYDWYDWMDDPYDDDDDWSIDIRYTHTHCLGFWRIHKQQQQKNSIQFNSKWNIILAPSFIAKKTCIIHTQWMNEWMKCWHTHTDPQYGQNMIHWSFDHWPKIIKFLSYPFFFYCVREIKKKTSLCPDSNKQKKTIFSIRFNNNICRQ